MVPLRRSSFRYLAAGQLISNLGDALYSVALAWYVLSHGGGTVTLGLVLAAYGIPRTALLLVGGHASDRWHPWTLMLITDAARMIAIAFLAFTAATGPAREAELIPIAIVLGAAEGLFLPSSFTIIPALLPADERQQGNALSAGISQITQLAGPILGGALVATTGPATGFAIDAVTFLISAMTLAGVRTQQPRARSPDRTPTVAAPTSPTVRQLLLREPILRLMLLTDALINLCSTGMGRVALPALAKDTFHLGAGGYGAMSACLGAGLLIGTLVATRMPPIRKPLLASTLTLLPCIPLLAILPETGRWQIAAGVLILAFVPLAIGNLLTITALQQWAPPGTLGRVTGLLMLASMGMLPISVLLAGVVIHLAGVAFYFAISAATLTLAAAIELRSTTWRSFQVSGA
jgi:MFS family permease